MDNFAFSYTMHLRAKGFLLMGAQLMRPLPYIFPSPPHFPHFNGIALIKKNCKIIAIKDTSKYLIFSS